MPKLTTLLLTAILMVGIGPQTERPRTVPLGEEFIVAFGDRVLVEGTKLRIDFLDVPTDSRCPATVVCVWAGAATINLEVKKKRKEAAPVLLSTGGPTSAEYRGFVVRLVRLDPYPQTPGPKNIADYRATLIVTLADDNK